MPYKTNELFLQVVDVHAFRAQKRHQNFTNMTEIANNIYNKRWGDAPVRFVAQMFFDVKTQVKHFCEFAYEHIETFGASC